MAHVDVLIIQTGLGHPARWWAADLGEHISADGKKRAPAAYASVAQSYLHTIQKQNQQKMV